MEEQESDNTGRCCFGCLCRSDESIVQNYVVKNETLKTVYRAETIMLCYICKRMAQHTDTFIQNVQSNQILLENFQDLMDSTFHIVRKQALPVISLSHFPLDVIHLNGNPSEVTEELFTVISNCSRPNKDVKIKLEMKEEDGEILDHLEGEFVDDDEFQDPMVKEEDDFPLKELLKEELEEDEIDLKCLKKTLRKRQVKSKHKNETDDKVVKVKTHRHKEYKKIKYIFITKEQCIEERARMMTDKKYVNCLYKCENCIKGFNFQASYEKHLEKHSKESGDYECDVCRQRFPSEDKLQSHKRYHQVRYQCGECDLTRVSRLSIKDHYTATHCQGYYQYNCPHCPKIFTRQISLRRHICYVHTRKERVSCSHCHKTYANKECLKAHIMGRHPKDEASGIVSKRYVCAECGMGFAAPSQLRHHEIKHSARRDYYCVECDKSFKSDAVLQHHLKTTASHIKYRELPLSCLHCDKRFAIKRDLERHTNRVHLNIRPHQCDKCDKAYVNAWSLREHKKLVHEGYKRPLKYPCTMCDKVFNRNQILKSHIRTHTGERPYQCDECPAQFSQPSVRATHARLVHRKLARDGRPKQNVKLQ